MTRGGFQFTIGGEHGLIVSVGGDPLSPDVVKNVAAHWPGLTCSLTKT